jgi:3-deoxy-manno-octulosonate cytidylyltransferase (CMP-KDO synthetase)
MQRMICIPARLESRRLPGKPLQEIAGKPLLRWVWELAVKVPDVDAVVVAAPDEEILHAAESWGARVAMTASEHPSGTHRTAQAVWDLWDGEEDSLIVNLQADEPLLLPEDIQQLFEFLVRSNREIATMVAPLGVSRADLELMADLNQVKVAYSGTRCFWFSRAPLAGGYAHAGVYGFRAPALFELAALTPTRYARAEGLEQLTWLEHLYEIHAIELATVPLAVNTQLDLERLRWIMEQGHD